MAGFRKAKAQQAALKMGLYGPPGSGKTFTALLFAEGLAKLQGKRVAIVDTEHGTDFYVQSNKSRQIHPEEFDVDAIYTRSITEVLNEVKALDQSKYCAIIIDSITHIWESAIAAHGGKLTKIGTIPITAWGKIKKPYKELMTVLLSSSMHVFILGRQGGIWEEDENTGELKKVGDKMKAEGETPYEPHILGRMEAERKKDGSAVVTVFWEKDRTSVHALKTIAWPSFDNVIKPLLPLMGKEQAKVKTEAETAMQDSETLLDEEAARASFSKDQLRTLSAEFDLCTSEAQMKAVSDKITPALKKQMVQSDVDELKEHWLGTKERLEQARR